MKKILCLLLALTMVFSLCACGKKACEITWESTPEECIEQMKKVYKISDEDIDYDPSESSLCEFNFYEKVKFEDFEEAELEFYFDDNKQPVLIRVYDDSSNSTEVENILNLTKKHLGKETEAKFEYQTANEATGSGTLYYWDDGKTGAYIHVGINGGPYVTFVNLNNELGKEEFDNYVTAVKID